MDKGQVSIAYLVSRYPAVSHTFILREVLHLKSLGYEINVASINEPGEATNGLTIEEKAEAEKTYYIKRDGLFGALRSNLITFATSPLRYFSGLIYALKLAGPDLKKLAYNFFYFIEAAMLGQWMHKHNQTHLHVHFATQASTVGIIAKKIFSMTLSITVHGPDEFYDVKDFFLAEKIRAASFICCIGNFARSQLMALSAASEWNKFEITPLGVDPEIFKPKPFRKDPDPFEIICVGRLVRVKGQRVLLEAVEGLLSEGRRIRLRYVGDGPDRAGLEKCAKEKGLEKIVIFEGAINQDRIRELYSQADVFVLASFAEGIPVVLMEAMAMEIPCIATRITGIPELIRDDIDGLLVSASDVGALKNAITSLIDDSSLRLKLGRAGRRRVIEKYNLKPNTDRLAEVFRKRLSKETPEIIAVEATPHRVDNVESNALTQKKNSSYGEVKC